MAVSLARRLVRACRSTWQKLRFWRPDGYRVAAYWDARHGRFGFDRRGVGDLTLTDEQNRTAYTEARGVLLDLCAREGVNLGDARVLEIGCGTGYHAQTCVWQGCTDYTGVDITDRLFHELRARFPDGRFERRDVSRDQLTGTYDVILMIDVTQHIVNADGFEFAMRNIQRCLAPDGTAILTSWLRRHVRRTLYEVERPLADYERAFPDWAISAPVRFRDKFLFSVTRAPKPVPRQA